MCCVLWPVFTRGQTHSTDTAQHRDTQHSHIIVLFFNVVVSSMLHDHMYVYFPVILKVVLSKGMSVRTREMVNAA